jgi:2,4-didehydro-3-deoxy-L-rhamnonate hydrolase
MRVGDAVEAQGVIADYVAANDASERSWQFDHNGQRMKSKSFPTANRLGSCPVTSDEIPDSAQLELSLSGNGELRQQAMTGGMIFGVHYLVRYLSQFVQTRTGRFDQHRHARGGGARHDIPRYLLDGDLIEPSISGLGRHHSRVRIPVLGNRVDPDRQ